MKFTIILLFPFLFILQQLSAQQQLLLDQKGISKNKIQWIMLENVDLFRGQEDDAPSEDGTMSTILTYDKDGRLLSVGISDVENSDTVYLRNDLFVYAEGRVFMWVSKRKWCGGDTRAENNGECFLDYGFTLFDQDSAGMVLKNYGADEQTAEYLEFYFNGSQKETGMYLREMKWKKRGHDLHHVDAKTKEDILGELFIFYSYTSDEKEVVYDEETGDSTVLYFRDTYEFSDADYRSSRMVDEFVFFRDITIRKSDMTLLGSDRKKIDKLGKYKGVKLECFRDAVVEISFETASPPGEGIKRN